MVPDPMEKLIDSIVNFTAWAISLVIITIAIPFIEIIFAAIHVWEYLRNNVLHQLPIEESGETETHE